MSVFINKCLYLHVSLTTPRHNTSDRCKEKTIGHKEKAFIGALFLAARNLANSIEVKDEATIDAQCGICISANTGKKHIRRGLLRCSFNFDGQCKSLELRDE